MIIDATIMGGDIQKDIEIKIIKCCGLDYREYYSNGALLSREVFSRNLDKVLNVIEEYAKYDFRLAFQVLGRFVLLIGVNIPKRIKINIIKASNWSLEAGFWEKDLEDERKFRLNDLRRKIKSFSGLSNPLDEDLVFRPDLVKFYMITR